ncbi:unnamed protein product [Parascedosporium putredinis]|uniref:Uncharacterized protein n=1 Tax=Parascedosporium putredinis TaxID=1442378 RepID=A0A9P1M9N9_9PEZI|nr:unnamed protein product [Parascedosporium putredinis]CAI7992412.1 unnamed protein product [Parascedosporium putredinis]
MATIPSEESYGAQSPLQANYEDRRHSAAGSSYGSSRECPAEGCPFRAKSKKDVDRHYMSVHAKADLFFCPRRTAHKRGWSRKDARDRHSYRSDTPDSESRATARPTNFTVEDVMSQLEEEKRLRLDLEHELRVLRRSYDERASLIKRILSSAL